MTDTQTSALHEALLDAALLHVPFDGWSGATLDAAIADTGADSALARAAYPRGAVDLALAYHTRGDDRMRAMAAQADLGQMRYSEKVAALVWMRIEASGNREIVRRGTTLFALPQNAADGARAIWGTADAIWNLLGDTSDDVNWYSKRAILSGVYSATVLYWLGDDSPDNQASRDFLDRRIGEVMQFEKFKAQARKNPALGALMAGPAWLLGHIKAPGPDARAGMPGQWHSRS